MNYVKLPGGQIVDELPFSFSFRGELNLIAIDPDNYLSKHDPYTGLYNLNYTHSFRLKEVQIKSEVPVSIIIIRSKAGLDMVMGKWSTLGEDKYPVNDYFDFSDQVRFKVQAFYADKVDKVLVHFNGLLRRPIKGE